MLDNIFVNHGRNEDTVNEIAITHGFPTLEVQLHTKEEYENWVKGWRVQHEQLVSAIQFFKKEKNRLRDEGSYEASTRSWNRAKRLGAYATHMYEYRTENKEQLHLGNYVEKRPQYAHENLATTVVY